MVGMVVSGEALKLSKKCHGRKKQVYARQVIMKEHIGREPFWQLSLDQ